MIITQGYGEESINALVTDLSVAVDDSSSELNINVSEVDETIDVAVEID